MRYLSHTQITAQGGGAVSVTTHGRILGWIQEFESDFLFLSGRSRPMNDDACMLLCNLAKIMPKRKRVKKRPRKRTKE